MNQKDFIDEMLERVEQLLEDTFQAGWDKGNKNSDALTYDKGYDHGFQEGCEHGNE